MAVTSVSFFEVGKLLFWSLVAVRRMVRLDRRSFLLTQEMRSRSMKSRRGRFKARAYARAMGGHSGLLLLSPGRTFGVNQLRVLCCVILAPIETIQDEALLRQTPSTKRTQPILHHQLFRHQVGHLFASACYASNGNK